MTSPRQINIKGFTSNMKKINFIKIIILIIAFLLVGSSVKVPQKFIDHNHNGVMDVYENPNATVEERVKDLISRMTLLEKIGQMQQLWQLDMMNESGSFDEDKAVELVKEKGIGSFENSL